MLPVKIPSKYLLSLLAVFIAVANAPAASAADVPKEAPYVNSKAIKERFDQITDQDMDTLRQKKIVLASRSFGLNLHGGLTALAKANPKYELLKSYERYDVNRAGGDLSIIPADVFSRLTFVHFLATVWPLAKRVDEMDTLFRQPPHNFGQKADAAIIFYHTASPDAFDYYASKMDALRTDFPKTRFIYVCSGLSGPQFARTNEPSFAFSEKIRARYKGKVPVYDMGAILSDDFRDGHVFCPEYSKDPVGLHPSAPAGVEALAKGFLLVLAETFRQDQATAIAAASSLTPLPPVAAVTPATKAAASPAAAAAGQPEVLPATHPDYKAVRAILDANNLKSKTVESASVIKNGRIVELFLQEGGIAELGDSVGALTALQKLHLYGDRNLPLPRLRKVSPAIGQCTALRELLLNQNELTTLPVEITKLQKLKLLSLAENHLRNLPPEVEAWAKKFDPKGLELQK